MKQVDQLRRHAPARAARWWLAAAAAGLIAISAVAAVLLVGGGATEESKGLPDTPDYHSLLVDPADSQSLILGTHNGLYASNDGGRTWRFETLADSDAMNLVRPRGETVWLAGHNVFKKTDDAGATWKDVRPAGLPTLDIHGFAVDARSPKTLYAAVAGQGLYRSTDGGDGFTLASSEVGGAVMGLVSLTNGRLLAGDMQRGLLVSADRGAHWRLVLEAPVLGLAVNPREAGRVLATGRGILLSTDGGASWRQKLELPDGAGPVAWSGSDPKIAYVISFDRRLLKTGDGGETWHAVS
jgi:photosystem II stability/assembly factor-like uncharacterized protein